MNYPLCVDLDGTLIYTDILQEAIIRFIKQDLFINTFLVAYWLFKGGKAYLKQQVVNHTSFEASTLPYNMELLTWIKAEKEKYRKIVLVTATDKKFADAVANYLGVFDEVFASNGKINLRSHQKEQLLNKHYGEKKYDYVGNAIPDLPVWRSAHQAIVVSNSTILSKKIKKNTVISKIFSVRSLTLNEFLYTALRIHQYAKNLLLFVPLLAAHIIFNLLLWEKVTLGFLSFCFIASSAYLVNDLFDIEADRKNKKNRAVARGLLTIPKAMQMSLGFFLLALLCTWHLSIYFKLILISYYFLTLFYSLYFKSKLLIDVIALAILYTIRIIAGLSLLGTNLYSTWLLLFSLFFFLSLAILKRISELHFLNEKNKTAIVGRAYKTNHDTILKIFGITCGLLSILVFALYLNSSDALRLYQYPQVLLFVFPILAYWIMRIWLLAIEGKVVDDPVLFAIRDKASYYCIALILLIMFFASK